MKIFAITTSPYEQHFAFFSSNELALAWLSANTKVGEEYIIDEIPLDPKGFEYCI